MKFEEYQAITNKIAKESFVRIMEEIGTHICKDHLDEWGFKILLGVQAKFIDQILKICNDSKTFGNEEKTNEILKALLFDNVMPKELLHDH